MRQMLESKRENPRFDTVQYYWLDDLVECVKIEGGNLKVLWKCGLENTAALNLSRSEEPTYVAERYRNALEHAAQRRNQTK